MLDIEVELPHETKIIEWNKLHPTFNELKNRLHECGIAIDKNCCVEVEKAGKFSILDDNDLINGLLIRVRASHILCKTSWTRPKPNQPPIKDQPNVGKVPKPHRDRSEELFVEGVIPFVGRIFVLPKKFENISLQECTGTVALIGSRGESIGAFHSLRKAWRHPRRYDVYIKYMNHNKQPCFPANVVAFNEEVDIFVAVPLPPFEFNFPKFLQLASGVAVGDTVHCFGFPKLINEVALLQLRKSVDSDVPENFVNNSEFPSVFSGSVCFAGWKQVLADYRSFSNSSGAIVVDDHGHLKGIHVSSLSAMEYTPELSELEPRHNMGEKTKALYEHVNKCLPQLISKVQQNTEAAVFVPVNVLMTTLNQAMKPTAKVNLYS